MKRFAVVFEEHNARIVKGPEVDALVGKPNVLVNPMLPPGVPPHHWKLENGKIVVMSAEERGARDLYHTSMSPEVKTIVTPAASIPSFSQFEARPVAPAPVDAISRLEVIWTSVAASAATALIVTGLGFLLHAHH